MGQRKGIKKSKCEIRSGKVEMLVKVEGVSKSFSLGEVRTRVLRNVNLEVDTGEFVVILGKSGSGKTTLLNLIGCIDAPDGGRIIVDGVEVTRLNDDQLTEFRRDKIGFVFQFYNLLPTLTALENVEMALEPVLKDGGEVRTRALKYLDLVGLRDKAVNFPFQLSGGEQQRVAIARALAKEPILVLADEPTGNLDEETSRRIVDLMLKLNRETGTTFIVVTHDSSLSRIADKTIYLRSGRVYGVSRREEKQRAGMNR